MLRFYPFVAILFSYPDMILTALWDTTEQKPSIASFPAERLIEYSSRLPESAIAIQWARASCGAVRALVIAFSLAIRRGDHKLRLLTAFCQEYSGAAAPIDPRPSRFTAHTRVARRAHVVMPELC